MEYVVIFGLMLLPYLIGTYSIDKSRKTLYNQKDLLDEFIERLNTYCESKGQDHSTYEWLLKKSLVVQRLFGAMGFRYQYRPAFENYIHTDYQIFSNELPKIRENLINPSWTGEDDLKDSYNLIYDTLVKMIGHVENSLESKNYQHGPIQGFAKGIKIILQSPFSLLNKLDLMSAKSVRSVSKSKSFNMITGITALLTLIGLIMEIFIDWPEFIQSLF